MCHVLDLKCTDVFGVHHMWHRTGAQRACKLYSCTFALTNALSVAYLHSLACSVWYWMSRRTSEREMCPWAISKYFGDLVSNTSAKI
jgi:hypothetical protein